MKRLIYLYVTPYFPEPGRHYGSYGYDFVMALKRNSDYDVRVFVPGKGEDYDFEGCHVYRFPVKSLPSATFPFLFAKHNRNSFLNAVRRAGIDLNDVVACHGNTATYSIYPLEIKRHNPRCLTILHHHDLDGFGLRLGRLRHVWLHKMINFFIVRYLFEALDCHVFISEASKKSTLVFPDTSWSFYDDYRRLSQGLRWLRPAKIKNSIILWNGVNEKRFNDSGRPDRTMGNGFVVGCVGNFVEVKDHLAVIEAVAKLRNDIPEIRLEILGTNGVGRHYENAKKFVRDNGLEEVVEFLPNMPQDKLPDIYRRWDLMVLPSFFEGFGCVYLESLACGTPFIACKGQGIEDVLPEAEKGKWLCNPHDVQDLAKKIHDYYMQRQNQILKGSVGIDQLVGEFIREVEKLRREEVR